MFGYLQDNGGPTLTHTLLASSVAIDSTTAQRGMARPAGLACDVGAFEYHPTIYLYLPLILR